MINKNKAINNNQVPMIAEFATSVELIGNKAGFQIGGNIGLKTGFLCAAIGSLVPFMFAPSAVTGVFLCVLTSVVIGGGTGFLLGRTSGSKLGGGLAKEFVQNIIKAAAIREAIDEKQLSTDKNLDLSGEESIDNVEENPF